MTGDLNFNNTVKAQFKTNAGDVGLKIQSSNTSSYIDSEIDHLYIRQKADNKDIIFQSDDGSGGVVEYFRLDGSTNTIPFGRSPHLSDGLRLYFGNDTTNDASIRWDSTASQLFIDGTAKFLDNIISIGNIETTNGVIDIYKFTNTSSSNDGTTLLSLTNNVGTDLTDGDLQQQKTFIDFNLLDANNNEYPQVRIGAEVGQNGNANSQTLEGCGAFLVYTNNATGDGPATPTGLVENLRVDFEGTTTTPKIRLSGTADASLTSTEHGFQVGSADDANIIADRNEIMARNNGAVSPLAFNPDGGDVTFGGNVNASTMSGSGNLSVHGHTTTTELNLPSGGQVDWASGDARIVEGLVNNYSLSFQTFNGTAIDTALRLDGNNLATFASNIKLASNTHILIGTDSGDGFNTNSLIRIQDTGHAYVQIKAGDASQGGFLIGDVDDDYMGGFLYSNASNTLSIKVNNTDALTISSSFRSNFIGKVRVNGSAPIAPNSNFDNLVISDTAHAGMSILSGTNEHHGAIYFGDPDANASGRIKYLHDDDAMTFHSNGSLALTINSSQNSTFAGTILSGAINIASTSDGLFIKQTTNAGFASIKFSDDTNDTQFGYIKYTHADSQSRGGGSSLWLLGQNDHTVVVGDGTNTGRIIVSTQNSVDEVDYGFYGDLNTGMYQPANNQLGLVADGSRKLLVSSSGVQVQNGTLLVTSGGSAASPAIQVGDTDSGFYDSGANQIGVSLGGVLAVDFRPTTTAFVNGASFGGNVVVNNQLTINIDDISTGENRGLKLYNENSTGQQWNITTGITGVENTSFCVRDSTNNVNAFTMAKATGQAKFAGNLGVGIDPVYRIHAYHPTTNVVARFESGDPNVWIDLHDNNSSTYGVLLGAEGTDFIIAPNNTQVVRVKQNGRVGINTDNPSTSLEVHNTIKIGETGVAGGRLISGDSMIFQIDSDDSSGTSS